MATSCDLVNSNPNRCGDRDANQLTESGEGDGRQLQLPEEMAGTQPGC